MKIKKILALAVSLAMVLSIVPAFGITAGAAAPELDALALVSLADYAFVGQTTPPTGNSGAIAWNDSRLAGTNWEGWSGAAQLYWASGAWVGVPNSLFIDGNASKGMMYVSDAVKVGTSGKDYIVITWDSGTVDAWTDMKIIDADSNAVDTFRYRSCNAEGINPHWAYDGTSSSFAGVCADYTYDDADGVLDTGNGIADARTVYYMVYANNQSGTGYTASYYYKTASGSDATWIGTKSYATGSVNGLSGIEIGNGDGAQRMFNFAIYAGVYPADAYTASAVTTVDGNEIKLISTAVTGDTALSVPAKTFLYNGKIYSIAAQDVNVTSAAPTATVEATVTQEYAATNLATTAGSATALGNNYPTVAGNGTTANQDDDKAPLMTGSWQNYGSAREITVTMNAPVLSEGQVAILHLAVGALRKNIDNSTVTTYRLKATANGKTAYTSSVGSDNNSTSASLNPPQEMTANVTELLDGSGSVAIAFNGHSGGVGLVNVSNGEIGGTNEGVASYIEVVDGYKVTLPEGAYITEAGTKRTATNNVVYVAPNANIVVYDSTGTAMAVVANGTVHSDGKVTVTDADTVISEGQMINVNFVNENKEEIYSASGMAAKIGDSVTIPARNVFILDADYNGTLYEIPETTTAESTDVTVYPSTTKYPAIEDMLVSDNEVWGIKKANENSVFVAAGADVNRAPLEDANGDAVTDGIHTPSTLGKSRVGFAEFPVVDVAAGQKAYAKFYVRDWHGNTFSNDNTSIRLAAYAVNDSSWTALSDGGAYDSANAPMLEAYPNAIFSEAHDNSRGYVTFDVTDAMKAAKAAGLDVITFRLNSAWGAAYIAEREACVPGGAYEGMVSYIEVADAGAFEVTAETGAVKLTKNGSAVSTVATVTADDDVRLVAADDTIVIDTALGKYRPNTNLKLTGAVAFGAVTPYTLGITAVDGAQVRIGDGVTAENKVGKGSGLRFIATYDANSIVTMQGADCGLLLTAKDSEKIVKIPVEKTQADGVFTAAITNLSVSNYNREFTVTPYADIQYDGETEPTRFEGTPITRSIYAVSAGLLSSGEYTADGDEYKLVYPVLNAYANQVGIRLNYNSTDGFTADTAYTGDVLFDVTSVPVDGAEGSYTVTITPINANVDLAAASEWWINYVRVNNNNSEAKTCIADGWSFGEDGTLTFTFTFPPKTAE